jgi:hypothetical protein
VVATLWDSPNRMGGSMGQDWWRYLSQDTLPNQYPGPGIISPAQDQGRTVSYAGIGPTKMDTGLDYQPLPGQGWWQNQTANPADSSQPGNTQKPSIANIATTPTVAEPAQARDWALPGWAWGGNQLGGGTYNAQTGQWAAGAPLAAGSDVYGAKLPVAYNSANDRGGLEYNGKNVETFWSRMLRWAQDYRKGNNALTPEQAMQMAIDRLRRDNGGTLQGTGFAEGGQPQPTVGPGNNAGGTPVSGTGGYYPGRYPGDPDPGKSINPALGGPSVPATGGTQVPELGIIEAMKDPQLAYNYFLANQNGGKLPTSHGFFDQFIDQYLGPMISAAMNATANAAGGQAPSSVQGLFGSIGQALQGNGLFSLFSDLARQGVAGGMGTVGQNGSAIADLMRSMAPLTTFGMNQLGRDAYYTNQADTINNAIMQDAYDPLLGKTKNTDFQGYFKNSPFYNQYYGQR